MWDHKLTPKENIKRLFLEYWLLLAGLITTIGALLYRPYGQDMQFLMDLLPALGSVLTMLGVIRLIIKKQEKKRSPLRIAYYFTIVVLLLWASSVAAATATMLSETQRNQYVAEWDVILLGVELSAEHNTAILDSRLKSTAFYLNANPESRAILSGGAYQDETMTTAQYMKDYLVTAGIAADRLILEEASQTVPEAIANSKAIVEELQGGTQVEGVGLISNEYQLYRARKYAARQGLLFIKMCVATPLDKLLPLNFFVREYFKIVPMWLGR